MLTGEKSEGRLLSGEKMILLLLISKLETVKKKLLSSKLIYIYMHIIYVMLFMLIIVTGK